MTKKSIRKTWCRAEIMMIKLVAGRMTVDRIGLLIGRTGAAVRTKAREIGICLRLRGIYHQSVKYPATDVQLSRELHESGLNARTIAEKMEIPISAVRQFIYFERRVSL
ncbi:DNA-binding protein [Atlantibacter hermannii]|uniref:DNA-binding protein n=1 Tax=Atlantibacter hermannii TaxID=565 RepID=UPI000A4F63C5|nr:DNA-binding protein [Atlantibacter hermannii]